MGTGHASVAGEVGSITRPVHWRSLSEAHHLTSSPHLSINCPRSLMISSMMSPMPIELMGFKTVWRMRPALTEFDTQPGT